MRVPYLLGSVALFFSAGSYAHSWLECVDTVVPEYAQLKANPKSMSQDKEQCKGYPRNLPDRPEGTVWAPDWIDESSNYMYSFKDFENQADASTAYACGKNQRQPTSSGPPAAKVTPGQKLLMRHWGNGHGSWDPKYSSPGKKDPGLIRVFWSGKKETDLKYKKDLTPANWIPGAQGNFSKEGIFYYSAPGEKDDSYGYFSFTVPSDIETGRHGMVWTWNWTPSIARTVKGGKGGAGEFDTNWDLTFSTCFDLEVSNGASSPSQSQAAQQQKFKDFSPYADACDQPCNRGGMVGNTCDPSKEKCPGCRRMPDNGNNMQDCFDTCSSFIPGFDCATIGKPTLGGGKGAPPPTAPPPADDHDPESENPNKGSGGGGGGGGSSPKGPAGTKAPMPTMPSGGKAPIPTTPSGGKTAPTPTMSSGGKTAPTPTMPTGGKVPPKVPPPKTPMPPPPKSAPVPIPPKKTVGKLAARRVREIFKQNLFRR
ncbi:hypothetical protein DFS34DRAFT_693569 [Phlyctochytrium arcticum]|nr:hypothetical protein DFS34DRAFT_693569 [Phlyctochytrium arcticum]